MLQNILNIARTTSPKPQTPASAKSLHLVPSGTRKSPEPSSIAALAVITSRRCSSFFAEAAVLVLVFGILDYFMQKGRIELPWIIGAVALSISLLIASILTDFTAHRWVKAHP